MKRGHIALLGAGAAVVMAALAVMVILAPNSVSPILQPTPTRDAETVAFAEQSPRPPELDEPLGPGLKDRVDPDWATETAAATGIPRQAVVAYAGAILGVTENFPECTLGWNTLAGIGKTESDHARHGGGVIQENGHVEPLIFGVPLTGGDVDNIPDSDGGEFDGTAEIDRAIGPMQIIPSTWRSWPADGNGDGVPDPHNIYDATISAANYLCHAESDWLSGEGWLAGVASYNSHSDYAQLVASAAQKYADAVAD